MGTLAPVDAVALGLMALAAVRGTWIGLIRESFSLGALAAACLAVRFGTRPVADWLAPHVPAALPELWLRIACGAVIALLAIAVVGGAGRLLRQGARAVGLGLADRVGGAFLGAAEGALVVTLLVLLCVGLLGRNSPKLRDTATLAWVERAEALAAGQPTARPTVDVSAAPPSPREAEAAGQASRR